jgi:DNA repair protein RadC
LNDECSVFASKAKSLRKPKGLIDQGVEAEPQRRLHKNEPLLRRLLHTDLKTLSDVDMLDTTLCMVLQRGNSKLVAELLIARFGTFAAVVIADTEELMAIEGLGEAGATALKIVGAATLHMLREKIRAQSIFSTRDALWNYLRARLQHEQIELFLVLYFDQRNRLICDKELWHGTVNHCPVYPRDVIRQALQVRASAMILVHNHPCGNLDPSWQDIQITKNVIEAAKIFEIMVHDHIIVGSDGCRSLRDTGLAPFQEYITPSP